MSEAKVIADTQDSFMTGTPTRKEMFTMINSAVQAAANPLRAEVADLKEQIALHMQMFAASEGIMQAIAERVGMSPEDMNAIGTKAIAEFDAKLKAAAIEMRKAAAQTARKTGHA